LQSVREQMCKQTVSMYKNEKQKYTETERVCKHKPQMYKETAEVHRVQTKKTDYM
jgi:hypothetical protein